MHIQKLPPFVRDYIELAKPRVTLLVVMTVIAGYYLGAQGRFDFMILFHTAIGTMLVAAGTSALNQLIERGIDAKMKRTKKRPLPEGRLSPLHAQIYGTIISIVGIVHLLLFVNALTALLASLTLASYVFLYTPLKKKSSLSTLVGAIPGALPPVGGWAAARGEVGLEAWVLFAIMFLWQIPHFLAIAWLYREDYTRGGLQVLPNTDDRGFFTVRHIIANVAALLTVSLLPTFIGLAGMTYFFGAILLGIAFMIAAIRVAILRSNKSARRLLLASVIYLPLLLFLMSYDKTWL
jgi:protoheme IX farnesyltransferase